ncbi:MAG: DNA polymerase IV [Eubacteriales bacterium]|nr:DNA polymerase IV [Eubacteriales bacterium]
MARVILHSDLNSFYASVECLHHPELRDKPVAVAGDVEIRHGIILAKNQIAKACGVKSGEAVWQARRKCPELITLPPDYAKYLRFSRMAKAIYAEYTDRVEPFGIDESWLDVSGSAGLFGDGAQIAKKISGRIKAELGVTVSVGVSFNKIFAKLGSDYKKPDAVTVFDHENFRELVWPLPVEDLLYVGPATKRKLRGMCIFTIGELARADLRYLRPKFGKIADVLHAFANGYDQTPVSRLDELPAVKSVGNSCTAPHDLRSGEDAKLLLLTLTESVAMRLREQGMQAGTVCVSIRDNDLYSFERQTKLDKPTDLTSELVRAALALFQANYDWRRPVRSLGVRVTELTAGRQPVQLDLYTDESRRQKLEALDRTVDWLRGRFGNRCVQRASLLQDRAIAEIDAKKDHIIHPVGFF